MNRRSFLRGSAISVTAAALHSSALVAGSLSSAGTKSVDPVAGRQRINVAFVISPGANVIDLAGPWEVFQDVMLTSGTGTDTPFRLYTVSDAARTLTATGGLRLAPNYTLRNAPRPSIVCVGAQRGSSGIHAWLREQAQHADVVMSVCTGAFQLARAGLLDGRRVTTHHEFWDSFEAQHPQATLVRGSRFVVDEKFYTAGGLTSGIDLALHVVQRYFGTETAARTARYMEYESERWKAGGA
jgi:transcriptional regulator GlxA family with amidase domain